MFKYRLEPLLKYRKSLEEDQQRQLAIANRALYVQKEKITGLKASRKEAMAWRSKAHEGSTNSPYLLLYDNYLEGVAFDIKFHSELERITELKVDTEREKLIEFVKKRRTIELHREKENERYIQEEARKERIQNDEMAIMRAGRDKVGYA